MRGTDILDQRIIDSEHTLDAAAGSSSLCSLSRSGTPMPGIKYPEGAWVALREVRNLVRAGDGSDGDMARAVDAVRRSWAGDLARHTTADSGPDWIAYLTGGLDAVDALAETLTSVGE